MAAPTRRENPLLNLLCNLVAPSLVLSYLSTPERLGPVGGLVLAVSLPLAYGAWDYWERRKANFISIIGFFNILLTGGLGLMQVGPWLFACKEAAVPGVIALAVWGSLYTGRPLVRELLYNDQVINVPRVEAALEERGARVAFEQLLVRASHCVVVSFLLSAVLNFLLARWILKSPGGTPEFNQELGRLNLLSWPVIAVPSMAVMMYALWMVLAGIKRLTGLALDDVFQAASTRVPDKPVS